MPVFMVELWLDGYEVPEEAVEACETFIYEQLNFTASSVHIKKISDDEDMESWEVKKAKQ